MSLLVNIFLIEKYSKRRFYSFYLEKGLNIYDLFLYNLVGKNYNDDQ